MKFKWLNESKIIKSENRIEITAPQKQIFSAEALMNVRKGYCPNRFAMRPIIILKLKATLY